MFANRKKMLGKYLQALKVTCFITHVHKFSQIDRPAAFVCFSRLLSVTLVYLTSENGYKPHQF